MKYQSGNNYFKYLLIIFLITYSAYSYGQEVIVGQRACENRYIYYNPLLTIPPFQSYPLDVNGDGIFDFVCEKGVWTGGLGGSIVYAIISPINNNQIVFERTDSIYSILCSPSTKYAHIPKTFIIGDTINSQSEWSSNSFTLANNGHYMGCTWNFQGITGNNKYIGFRVLVSTDTLNGWIKLNSVGPGVFDIEEIACESNDTSSPVITKSIGDTSLLCGSNFVYKVEVSSISCLQYQWSKDGIDISGATADSLYFNSVTRGDSGTYTCQIHNAFDTVYCSSKLSVPQTIATSTPTILIIQNDTAICEGSAMTYYIQSVTATILSYQWLKDGIPMSGNNSGNITLNNLVPGDAGKYSCKLSVSLQNYCPDSTYTVDVFTNAVTLIINPNPKVVVTRIGNTLHSNYATGNYWSITRDHQQGFTGGGVSDQLTFTNDIFYYLSVEQNGCWGSSGTEALFVYVEFHLTPNPFENELRIAVKPENMYARWTLLNNLGQSVISGHLSSTDNILDTKELPPGIYYLSLNNKMYKLIKK